MNWAWLADNTDRIVDYLVAHIWLAGIPTVLGLIIAIPLGALAHRHRWLYPGLVTFTGLLYTIPSLALFIILPGLLGTKILDPLNVIVALTFYTVALMVRTVADGLASVPAEVRQSAIAMGYRPLHRLLVVELPIATPVIGAGLRVAAVSNVSLASVAAVIGVQQLGSLFTYGAQVDFFTPIIAGIVLCLLLALVFDLVIVGSVKLATPWARAVRS